MHFPVLLLLSAALSAVASPHYARAPSHHALAHRAAIPEAAPQPVVVPQPKKVRKRGDSSRCRTRSSSSAPTTTSTHVSSSSPPHTTQSPTPTPSPTHSSIVPPKNVGGDPTEEPSTSTPSPTPTPTTTKAASPPKTTSAAPSGNDPLGILTGTHSGDGTFYDTGLTACGITNSNSDFIAAVSHELFDNFPGYAGGNPNNNPLCGRKVRATFQGKSVDVAITDRCVGCAMFDLDFSYAAFDQLASEDLGRVHGVEWHWL